MSTPIRVLSVEDNPDDTEINMNALIKGGFEPTWKRVETPDTLWQALQDEVWDVILCDFYMPALDAFQALEIFKESGLDIPFIIVSGCAKEETMIEVMLIGANDYIFKDRIDRLAPAVKRELKSANVRRQKQMIQKELFKTGEKLDILISNLPVALYYCRAGGDFEIFFMSDSVKTFTGYSAEEFMSNPNLWPGNLHPEDAPRVYQDIENLLQTGYFNLEYRFKTAGGSYTWFLDSVRLVCKEDGTPDYLVGCWFNVNEKKQAEEALKQSEILFRALIENSSDLTMIINDKGEIDYISPCIENILGFSAAEVQKHKCLKYIYKEDRQNTYSLFQSILKEDAAKPVFNARVLQKNGGFIYMEGIGSKLPPVPPFSGIVINARDVTERMTAELELKKAYDSLEIKVQERTADLIRTNLELKEALANIKTLKGFIPICSNCRKIRADEGFYQSIEAYITLHTDAVFSHGICPDCMRELYPDYAEGILSRKKE